MSLIPKHFMMAKTTFHEILMAKLEPNSSPSANPSTPPNQTTSTEWSFLWQAPSHLEKASHPKPNAYPRSPRKVSPAKPPLPAPIETIIALTDLSTHERAAALRLIEWGAVELTTGLSELRLKRAYRRLAKRFHPDCPGGSALLFRELKGLYEPLREALLKSPQETSQKKAV